MLTKTALNTLKDHNALKALIALKAAAAIKSAAALKAAAAQKSAMQTRNKYILNVHLDHHGRPQLLGHARQPPSLAPYPQGSSSLGDTWESEE